ncbi:UDP-glucuronate 4-epimerase [Paucidesulfovibrio gracilis DSM 16080]|uniref:UDP-glucuronate 4-epimerase n=1 Tax=Paucidesulfovibrio gracilis DSM 16080 TaxID=1121449 RepID=A0A1T4XN71_9BACT|nr:NAD-dependent epimerase [Paucidesulfovibrio gracilis]SKA91020.1 UDP-glucuronate 4-epimerase [Paucidesulfovibrio gracilis DSM 16080]
MKVLVTGAAGFIGFHLSRKLLAAGHTVVGLDILNDYYDVNLKKDRLSILQESEAFRHALVDLSDAPAMQQLFADEGFDIVVNLAAQAGVRYSIENPRSYIDSNIVGFFNILEGCRHTKVKHLCYASSSSVYGMNTKMPLSTHDGVDHPMSLYAASKKSNEMMAHSYSNLFDLPTTGLRFFTVYGPWGRPDMALFLFTKAILAGEPINVFNYGDMERDFTFVDDIVEGVFRVMFNIPEGNPDWDGNNPDPASSPKPYRVYNIGNNNKVRLTRYIEALEEQLGMKAERNLLPMQPGDVPATWADVDDLVNDVDFQPNTSIDEGIRKFVAWYREYYNV